MHNSFLVSTWLVWNRHVTLLEQWTKNLGYSIYAVCFGGWIILWDVGSIIRHSKNPYEPNRISWNVSNVLNVAHLTFSWVMSLASTPSRLKKKQPGAARLEWQGKVGEDKCPLETMNNADVFDFNRFIKQIMNTYKNHLGLEYMSHVSLQQYTVSKIAR